MSSTELCAFIFLACALTFTAAQATCKGRCGAEYYRGNMCQCDYSCLSYGECCRDYESQCTTKNSCKGRCGENFKRGRLCSCDSDCVKYNQCCPDYKDHCDADEPVLPEVTEPDFSEGNDADDQLIPLVSPTSYPPDDVSDDPNFLNDGLSNNGDPEASPMPESTSGYGSSTADPLDQPSTGPTQDPDLVNSTTEAVTVSSQTPSDSEPTQADDNASTLDPATEAAPTDTSDVNDPTNSPDLEGATLELTTDDPPTATTLDLETTAETTVPTIASSDEPEATTLPSNTPEAPVTAGPTEASTVPENSEVTTMDPTTPIPEVTTSNPDPDYTAEGVTTESPTSLPGDAPTTSIPTPTDAGTTGDPTPGGTTADPQSATQEPTTTDAPSTPEVKPDPFKPPPTKPDPPKPSSKPETKPEDNSRDYQADDNNDTNLCSGRPVGAVTTLRNGTIVVFRGHYFWFLDPNREPGPARGITEVWGVPSPVDTVFTRCNCQGKTYILKGRQYWRYENDVLDPGYPKVTEVGFDGLRGQVTAALSVPQNRRRRESVYFFKRGGLVQKYSYQFGTGPTCGRKPQYAIFTTRNRVARQAVSGLEPAINIRMSWRGFPSTITAAVSVPSRTEPDGYKYHVFSRSKSYTVRMDTERPVIAAPSANTSPQSNDVFKCSKKA